MNKAFIVMLLLVPICAAIGQANKTFTVAINKEARFYSDPTTCVGTGCTSCSGATSSNGSQFGLKDGGNTSVWPMKSFTNDFSKGSQAVLNKTFNVKGQYTLSHRARSFSATSCTLTPGSETQHGTYTINVVDDLYWTPSTPANICSVVDLRDFLNYTDVQFLTTDFQSEVDPIINPDSYQEGATITVIARKFFDGLQSTDLQRTFTIRRKATISSTLPPEICGDASHVKLDEYYTQTTPGTFSYEVCDQTNGCYSSPAIYFLNGFWYVNPNLLGVFNGQMRAIFTAQSTGCQTIVDMPFKVGSASWSIDAGPDVKICKESGALALEGSHNATGTNITVGWSGIGVDNNQFLPADENIIGNQSYQLTYTVNNGQGCTKRAFKNIRVVEVVKPASGQLFVGEGENLLCAGNVKDLNSIITPSPAGGSYSSSNSTMVSRLSGSTLNTINLPPGQYPLTYTYDGCSSTFKLLFSEVANTPDLDNAIQCDSDSVLLQVNNPSSSNSYKWYVGSNGGTPVYNGAIYKTLLTSTQTFYVEANKSAFCPSTRKAVTATLVTIGPVSAGQDLFFCDNKTNTISLSGHSPTGGQYTGPGVSGFLFTGNALENNKQYELTYTVSKGGCIRSAVRRISLGLDVQAPIISVLPDTVVEMGERVTFEHNLVNTDVIWNYGDGFEGSNSDHFYYSPGVKDISLSIVVVQEGKECSKEFIYPALVRVTGEIDIITELEGFESKSELFIKSNPTSGEIALIAKKDFGLVRVQLYDITGKVFLEGNYTIAEGENQILSIDRGSALPNGLYILRANLINGTHQLKLLKQ